MHIGWEIKVGDILVIASMLGTVLALAVRTGGVHQTILFMQQEISSLKRATERITELLTQIAVQESRLNAQSDRLNTLDKRIEDLRRCDGFIAGTRGVDREFGDR